MTQKEYTGSIAKYVQKYASQYGIMVHSAPIAMAMNESGVCGESILADTYHNYHGLKCGTKWTGKSVNLKTMEEYTKGTLTQIRDNFRVFDNMEEGVKGFFEFIQLPRYQNLKGITDPKKFLETIIEDGYATDSHYVEKCMALIKQYDLTTYDVKASAGKDVDKMAYSAQKVVDTVKSWEGKNEADGSYKFIIDIYNRLTGTQLPRGTSMQYGWAWCACTWSAIAVLLNYLKIMPVEISCYYIIEAAKKMGCWVENDAHIPDPGDAVLYDWEDSGVGDNTGNPDHIGTVIYVSKEDGYMVVMEGNYSNRVKARTISLNGRYIRGFICPKYDEKEVAPPAQESGLSISKVAHEVIAGIWGNDPERTAALTAKGYNAKEVQAEVNRILNGSAATPAGGTQNQPTSKKVTATCYARYEDTSLAGTYVTTANLYCRNDAGKNKKALCLIPKGTEVHCYKYYNVANGVKWLYIQFSLEGVLYTGFSSINYLKKK